ncbi:hypothetical protein DPMN_108948 [Dreissena polymorpha]|uniref:Uncharacterized protein n=1 Tax=Dreissena polymorpha TaxID=45954 RepID=A0A9D4K9V7_DREPO|nr:hypothetical protein DPMN_108948 [Dreissena polymorpha]
MCHRTTDIKLTYSPDLEEGGYRAYGRMASYGESQCQLKDIRVKTIISTRTTPTIVTLNVRTMYETGKTSQVAAVMWKFNFTILGISESRWTGSWQKRRT